MTNAEHTPEVRLRFRSSVLALRPRGAPDRAATLHHGDWVPPLTERIVGVLTLERFDRFCKGDPAAADALEGLARRVSYGIRWRCTADRADAVQAGLLHVFVQREEIRGARPAADGTIDALLWRILKNKYLSIVRREQQRPLVEREGFVRIQIDTRDRVLQEDFEELAHCVQLVEPTQYRVYLIVHFWHRHPEHREQFVTSSADSLWRWPPAERGGEPGRSLQEALEISRDTDERVAVWAAHAFWGSTERRMIDRFQKLQARAFARLANIIVARGVLAACDGAQPGEERTHGY